MSQNQRFSEDLLKTFKENNSLTANDYNDIVKSQKFEVFGLAGLEAFRIDLFKKIKAEKSEEIRKGLTSDARKLFNQLKRKTVILPGGLKTIDVFIREKSEEEIEKSMNTGNSGNLMGEQLEDGLKKNIEKGDEGDDSSNQEEEGSQNNELSDDEKSLLALISEQLSNGPAPDTNSGVENSGGQEDPTPDEVKSLLESLQSKGYITYEDNNGVCNVTAITDEGKAAIGGESEQNTNTDDGEGNGAPDMGGGDQQEENNQMADETGTDNPNQEETDENTQTDNQNSSNDNSNSSDASGGGSNDNGDDSGMGGGQDESGQDEGGQDEGGENQEEAGSNGGGDESGSGESNGIEDDEQMDDNDLLTHAKSTDTETLKKFVSQQGVNEKHKKIAQAELDSREGGDQNGEQDKAGNQDVVDGTGQQNNGNDEEEEMFKKWIDSHFNDHDKEDLRNYVKELIKQSPAKLKELKGHFRDDFAKNNGGNKVDNIDEEEFDEWLNNYLDHQPFGDLKDYAGKLVAKNPKAFNDLKKKFTDLKSNNMLDN